MGVGQRGVIFNFVGDLSLEHRRNVRTRGINFGYICLGVIVGIIKGLPGRNGEEIEAEGRALVNIFRCRIGEGTG